MPRNEKVTQIVDGSTFETNMRKKAVKLARVNAPEKGKRGAAAAKKELEKLILGQTVTIDTVGRDDSGRTVANVKLGRVSINNAMKRKMKK